MKDNLNNISTYASNLIISGAWSSRTCFQPIKKKVNIKPEDYKDINSIQYLYRYGLKTLLAYIPAAVQHAARPPL